MSDPKVQKLRMLEDLIFRHGTHAADLKAERKILQAKEKQAFKMWRKYQTEWEALINGE